MKSEWEINIKEEFFYEEEREGFLVASMMKRYWASQLEVLKVIDGICNKLGVRYFADWGTLLGAIRHKGFIPWDDDVDICMLRKDYWRFVRNVQKELPKGYLVLSPFENYQHELGAWGSRIINHEHVCVDEQFLKTFHGCPYVSGVDIFPIDNVPDNIEEEELQKKLICIVNGAMNVFRDSNATDEQKKYVLEQVEESCRFRVAGEETIVEQLCMLLDSLCGMYAPEKTKYVRYAEEWMAGKAGKKIPSEAYSEEVYLPFEMIKIPVPIGYESVVRTEFGNDYMKPIQNTADHVYPAYVLQEKELKELLGKKSMSGKIFGIDTGF